MLTLSHFELLRRIRAREMDGLRGQHVEILCDRLSATLYRDVADLALAWAGVSSAVWRDGTGDQEVAAAGLQAASRLTAQLVWHVPRALFRQRRRLTRLENEIGMPGHLDRPGRVLYLRTDHAFDLDAGGSVAHVAGVINGLLESGVQVDAVSTDRLTGVPGDRVRVVTPVYGPVRNVRDLALAGYDEQLKDWLDGQRAWLRPDVVYHRHAAFSAIGPWLRTDWGVPFVCEYNGSFTWMSQHWDDASVFFPGFLDRAERLVLSSADLVVTVSEALREDAITRGAPADRVVTVPNAVDPRRYGPSFDDGSVRRRYGIPGNAVLAGFISTFGPWHGAGVLARAAAVLAGRCPNVHFLMIGDGAEMPSVRAIIESAGIGDRVTFTGLVAQSEGPAHLATCDILVSPHVPNPDGSAFFGSPTKLFEYMATGRAIVASELYQIADVLEHDRTAVLVPSGDVEALAGAISSLAMDRSYRERLGRAARAQALERHTWRAHVGTILNAMGTGRDSGLPTAGGDG